jgi:ectoine hydroxylase-related dioxygenase (phytanoyl-CoA dioxygenase family)
MNNATPQIHQQLTEQGYCVIPDVLDAPLLATLRKRFSDGSLAHAPRQNFGDAGAFIVADYHDPIMIELLTWPKTLRTLAAMGFAAPKLHNFYVSTKPPGARALPWHSDLFYRYDQPEPAELFLIYYLSDTTPGNGCLRVVPGSHRWTHDKRHAQPDNPAVREDEVDVPITAGDLFIGDRRILHATHPNGSDAWRTCLTIAYAPLFDRLPEPIRALVVRNSCLPPAGWWQQAHPDVDTRLQAILPVYTGTAQPIALDH